MRGKLKYTNLLAIGLLTGNFSLAANPIAFHQSNVLGTSLDLQVNTTSQGDADAVHSAVNAEIERLRKILSTYDQACELSKVNATLEPVKVSPELIEVLDLYQQWQTKTDGVFTAQVGELKKLYSSTTEPKESQIDEIVKAIKSPLWKIDQSASTVQRLADRQINVDSLGKGFIVSRAISAAKAKVPNVEGILLNIGGDISVTGFGAVGRKVKWTVMVADPANHADNAKPIAELRISNLSVATSGGYARNIKIGDKKFSHIIDPRTGKPAGLDSTGKPDKNSVASATVIAADNATANALATSICVLGADAGLKLVKSIPGAECLIITHSGGKFRSEGMKKIENIKPEPAEQSEVASSEGARWPVKYVVDVSLPVKTDVGLGDNPYAVVWIEDAQSRHVVTLAVLGKNPKWIRELSTWARYMEINNSVMGKITRATRAAGVYKFAWDGKDRDGKPVPQGTYTVWAEVAVEHFGRGSKSAVIECGSGPSDVKIDATDLFNPVELKYESHEGIR